MGVARGLKHRLETHLKSKHNPLPGTMLSKFIGVREKTPIGCNYALVYESGMSELRCYYHHNLPDGGYYRDVDWEEIEKHLLKNTTLLLVDPDAETREIGKVISEWMNSNKE